MESGPVLIRVTIADDHSMVRQGLQRYLDLADDIEVVGQASNGRDAVRMVEELRPDVALLDIQMGEPDGLEAARRIADLDPRIGIIMLTALEDRRHVVEAVTVGARGYVLKARDAEHLIQTVRLVAAGNLVIDPDLVGVLSDEIRAGRAPGREGLTDREVQILQLLAFGRTNREIGDTLFISPDTVKTHLEHIYEKLGTSDRTAAVAQAFRKRLIE
ncbi:MAG TPA: response regulator transcription factor [Actinomycetota bacterium]|nr:response regulator transcription factor [Actinomycetota bacterium]